MQRSVFYSRFLRIIALWLHGVILVMSVHGSDAENSTVKFAPPSNWVRPHFFGQVSSTNLDAGTDQRVLLLEQQINANSDETFVHSIRQILTTDGVQKGATITIDFNPGYESLTLHWARIWRDGQHLDRLDTNQVKVVQPEQELDQFILNGQKTAILVLDDVRVGDIVDYSYSIKGANPIFGGHFFAAVPVQLEQPAERLLTCLLWPKGRPLYAKMHGCSVQPVVIVKTNTVEYVWDLKQMPGLVIEDSLPGWYDPEAWVQLSNFGSWAEVNRWALSLFQVSAPFSPDLSQQIAAWKQIPDQEQQILSVLRFVQDQVRYFGIEIGTSTEKPADPSMVFSRRYGDCKDKSWLFVRILRALGIETYPVLVNTTLGHALDDWWPSGDAFDHCIAVVKYNGQAYWLDPTMSYQRGSLAAHYLPAYERGLIISPKTKGLTVIPQSANLSQTTTTEYFQIGKKDELTDLKVVTIAEGGDADKLREFFATTKRAEIQKSYVHFYSSLYPGIKASLPIAIEDEESQNKIQTTEFYSIENAWTRSDVDGKYSCEFYPSIIAALLKPPADTDRKLPLGIHFPQHQILKTEVVLPRAWPSDVERKAIADSAFTFQKYCRLAGNKLEMEYEYQSLTDSVSPEQISPYLQRLNQSSQSLGYILTWR